MNTYILTSHGAIEGRTRVEASNIHTAIKKAYFPMEFRRKALSIKKGEKVTIEVERIK